MEKSASLCLPLSSFFGFARFKKSLRVDLTEDQKQSNQEMLEQEIESLQSILNSVEFTIYEPSHLQGEEVGRISKLIKLSLVPQSHKKFVAVDVPKGISLELRCLPAIELYMALPDSYPSCGGPLFMLSETHTSNGLFYEQMKSFLCERLGEKW